MKTLISVLLASCGLMLPSLYLSQEHKEANTKEANTKEVYTGAIVNVSGGSASLKFIDFVKFGKRGCHETSSDFSGCR
jgi:hypothetical protein